MLKQKDLRSEIGTVLNHSMVLKHYMLGKKMAQKV